MLLLIHHHEERWPDQRQEKDSPWYQRIGRWALCSHLHKYCPNALQCYPSLWTLHCGAVSAVSTLYTYWNSVHRFVLWLFHCTMLCQLAALIIIGLWQLKAKTIATVYWPLWIFLTSNPADTSWYQTQIKERTSNPADTGTVWHFVGKRYQADQRPRVLCRLDPYFNCSWQGEVRLSL